MEKKYYSSEEVLKKLGRSQEEVSQFVREGLLREFLDSGKKLYRVEEVDNLASSGLGSGDSGALKVASPKEEELDLDLTPDELAQQPLGSLASSDDSDEIKLMGEGSDQINLDDTGQVATDKEDTTVITTHGLDALADSSQPEKSDDSRDKVKTGEMEDQVDLDSGASGSGLLDLSREADDTSLGAELLEEIYPAAGEGAVDTQVPTVLDTPTKVDSVVAAEAEAPLMMPEFAYVATKEDPTSGPYGAMLVVPLLVLIFLGFIVSSAMQGVSPSIFNSLFSYPTIWFIVLGALVLAILLAFGGQFMVARTGAPRPPKEKKPKEKKPKMEKPKKEKPVKEKPPQKGKPEKKK